VVQYHFADEAAQIRRLMQPAPPLQAGEPEEPGMNEETAALAVLGTDIESLGAAVMRLWGLDESVRSMVRRLAIDSPVHAGASDDETLRVVASAANEALDMLALPPAQVAQGLQRVVQRYGRVLGFGGKELQSALQASQHAMRLEAQVFAPPAPVEAPLPPGGLRAALAARSVR